MNTALNAINTPAARGIRRECQVTTANAEGVHGREPVSNRRKNNG